MTEKVLFSNLVASPFLWVAAAVFIACAAAMLFSRQRRGFATRFFLAAVFLAVLSGPMLLQEQRQYFPDKALIVVDRSASQNLGARDKASEAILADLQKKLAAVPNLDVQVVDAAQDSGQTGQTDVLSALEKLPFEATGGRLAATFLITDGQVHDVPRSFDRFRRFAPFHVLLSGRQDEFDRKVTVLSAPQFGIVNQDIKIPVRLDVESKNPGTDSVALSVRQNGVMADTVFVQPGETHEFTFKIDRPGQNVFEFSIPGNAKDLTDTNDRAAVIVNGVRDRLKVLLVSGAPHMGERAWRNLLKSDPAIDVVHFTILRSPFSYDPALPNELSLIAFPADELFLNKINEFDLIIFDRFSKYNLIEESYVDSIKQYIRDGGGFLFALGTGSWSEEDERGIGPLASVLPVDLLQKDTVKGAFKPALTAGGKMHPVTEPLSNWRASRDWGAWYAKRRVRAKSGEVLIDDGQKNPLLVLDTVGKGRVAALASDHFWIWSKSGAQAGPYVDLLRNVAHWLMKEPELEKDFLKAEARGMNIFISRRKQDNVQPHFSVTAPNGNILQAEAVAKDGWWTARMTAPGRGIYTVSDGEKSVFLAVGDGALAKEWADVVTTDQKLAPARQALTGGVFWLGQAPDDLAVRDIAPGARNVSGEDWAGIVRHKAFTATRQQAIRLLSWPFSFGLLLIGLILCWMAEGRKR